MTAAASGRTPPTPTPTPAQTPWDAEWLEFDDDVRPVTPHPDTEKREDDTEAEQSRYIPHRRDLIPGEPDSGGWT